MKYRKMEFIGIVVVVYCIWAGFVSPYLKTKHELEAAQKPAAFRDVMIRENVVNMVDTIPHFKDSAERQKLIEVLDRVEHEQDREYYAK